MISRNSKFVVDKSYYWHVAYALTFLLMTRIISMIVVPLNDSTEARYGEIARKMLETGNWVTPLHDYGVPFWAKPPLSFWLSAISMKCFGINEFAARLPALLLSIAIVWLIWDLAKRQSNSVVAILSVLVLSSSLYFFLNAGTVMTDPALVFCTTLSFVAFWHALVDKRIGWSYVFFVGLGLGLLAKGPIAIILVALPLFFWVLWFKRWKALWLQLPWFTGTLITLIIALPWYLLAESSTPGFLNYFLIGEHFNRFLTPGWTGDKYGMAHTAHWGMIWIYAVSGIFPWCFLGLYWMSTFWKRIPEFSKDKDGWIGYQLFGTIVPLIFFTFSSNIIYTYMIPILPSFALLFSEWWVKTYLNSKMMMYLMIWFSTSTGIAFLMVTGMFVFYPGPIIKSHKPVIEVWQQQHPKPDSYLYYWEYKTQYSAQFYSKGKVRAVQNFVEFCNYITDEQDQYLVIYNRDLFTMPKDLLPQLKPIKKLTINGEELQLVKVANVICKSIH